METPTIYNRIVAYALDCYVFGVYDARHTSAVAYGAAVFKAIIVSQTRY